MLLEMKRKRTRAEIAADKKRTGRPSMGDAARVVPVIVKVSRLELVAFRDAAKTAGQPLGQWILEPRRQELGER